MDKVCCPACKCQEVDLRNYDALLVLRKDFGLFSLTCPRCSTALSMVREIPESLRDEVYYAAVQIGTGTGWESSK